MIVKKRVRVALVLIATASLAACSSKGEGSDSAPTDRTAQAAELLKAAGGDMKIVEASGGDVEKAKLLAAGKKMAEQGDGHLVPATDADVPATKAVPEYKVVDDPSGGGKVHVYMVKARRSDGTFVLSPRGYSPGEHPTGEIMAAGGTEDDPIRFDEVQEIEAATGRPYEEGDTIYGRAQPL